MVFHYVIYTISSLVVVYLVTPFLVWLFPYFSQHIFFLNFLKSSGTDYYNLKKFGLFGGRNFYLTVDDPNVDERPILGVWHILPKSVRAKLPNDRHLSNTEFEQLVRDNQQWVLLYFHGSTFDRAYPHRREFYRIMSEMDFHVLAIDYRGYGDSTGRPTEEGVVADAKAIYKYVREIDPTKPVFVWGHSMGTGVACRTIAELSSQGLAPTALVLESPFNNLHDAVCHHPLSLLFRFLPWFEVCVIRPIMKSGLLMQSDEHIKKITCPILMFHAEDDLIIPVRLGRRLFRSARSAGRDVKYVEFDAVHQLAHSYVHRAKELPGIVMEFFTKAHNKAGTSS